MRAKVFRDNLVWSFFRVPSMRKEKFDALKAIVLIFSAYLGFWILFSLIFGDFIVAENSSISALIEEIADSLIIILLLRAAKKSYSITFTEMAITFKLPWKNISFGFLLGLILWLGAGVISDMLRPILPQWAMLPKEHNFVDQFANIQGVEKVILFFVIGFTTPVIEEIFHRGLIYSVLKRGFSIKSTIIFSCVLFGLGHIFPELVVISFLIGCGLAWLRERGKSLIGPIIAHITINCLSLVSSLGGFHG